MKLLCLVIFIALLSCNGEKKYHDVVANNLVQELPNALGEILNFQKELNKEYKDPETSPLKGIRIIIKSILNCFK